MQRVVLPVDVVCYALEREQLSVLLVKRAEPPFAETWALPGGAVETDEALDSAAARLLAERSGVFGTYLEQLYTFGDPDRDPRGRTLSRTYFGPLNAAT